MSSTYQPLDDLNDETVHTLDSAASFTQTDSSTSGLETSSSLPNNLEEGNCERTQKEVKECPDSFLKILYFGFLGTILFGMSIALFFNDATYLGILCINLGLYCICITSAYVLQIDKLTGEPKFIGGGVSAFVYTLMFLAFCMIIKFFFSFPLK